MENTTEADQVESAADVVQVLSTVRSINKQPKRNFTTTMQVENAVVYAQRVYQKPIEGREYRRHLSGSSE